MRAERRAGTTRAYVGIGSNLENPARQVRRALDDLSALEGCRLVARSTLYRNPAVGPGAQPDYVNAVAALDTTLGPHALLDALLALEARRGRVRGAERWAPRVLDLDLLLYGARSIDDERLTVPHPRLPERPFVLYPLHEIAPGLTVPGRGPLSALLEGVDAGGLEAVDAA